MVAAAAWRASLPVSRARPGGRRGQGCRRAGGKRWSDHPLSFFSIHSGFGASTRGINLPPDGIVAIPVPVLTTGLQLSNYTAVGRPGTYLPNGRSEVMRIRQIRPQLSWNRSIHLVDHRDYVY